MPFSEINKTLHIMAGVTFSGLVVATYFYIVSSLRSRQVFLLLYSLKMSFWLDLLMGIIILFQFMSAGFLIQEHGLSMQVPWVFTAHILFSLVGLIWLILLFLKWRNYKNISRKSADFRHLRLFHFLNIFLIILLLIILHDAIMHQTYVVLNSVKDLR